MRQEHPGQGFILRLREQAGQPDIIIQNLRTGELQAFSSWETLITYLKAHLFQGRLK